MNNEERIIQLLEEIRDNQKENLEKAMQMQKKATKRIFWILLAFAILIWIIYKLSS